MPGPHSTIVPLLTVNNKVAAQFGPFQIEFLMMPGPHSTIVPVVDSKQQGSRPIWTVPLADLTAQPKNKVNDEIGKVLSLTG
jgi:hypothetical protein